MDGMIAMQNLRRAEVEKVTRKKRGRREEEFGIKVCRHAA